MSHEPVATPPEGEPIQGELFEVSISENPYPKRNEFHSLTTQETNPVRTTIRTIFQMVVSLAAMWFLIVEALGISQTIPWVASSIAVAAAITRLMAVPQVNEWLSTYIPWLAPTATR